MKLRLMPAALLLVILAGGLAYLSSLSPQADIPAVSGAATHAPEAEDAADALTSPISDPTPSLSINPIFSEAEAISATLAFFPPGHGLHSAVGRLIKLETYTAMSGRQAFDYEPHVPIWMVAVLADVLTLSEVISLPGAPSENSTAAVGAYFLWDANSGYLIGKGAFGALSEYHAVINLPNEPLVIASATAWDYMVPTAESTHTPPALTASDRIFVLREDRGHLPDRLDYDVEVALESVDSVFGPTMPARPHALIISKPFLQTLQPPATPGGDSEAPYPQLYGLLENGHMLFVLDTSSNDVLDALGLLGAVPSFDPLGRAVSASDYPEGDSLYAGSGLHFRSPTTTQGGWSVVETFTSRPNPDDADSTPDPNGGDAAVLSSMPNYDAVAQTIFDFLAAFE
jgi:hypothetical protein